MKKDIIEAYLHDAIISFDGRIIECFFGNNLAQEGRSIGNVRRYHVAYVKNIEIKTDKNGKHNLILTAGSGMQLPILLNEVNNDQLSQVNSLISEIEAVKNTYKIP